MACVAEEQGEMLSNATAARVAQADMKGWKDFSRDVRKTIDGIVLPRSDAKKAPANANRNMADFFKSLSKAKGRNQTKGLL
jgi:hypothetical protein